MGKKRVSIAQALRIRDAERELLRMYRILEELGTPKGTQPYGLESAKPIMLALAKWVAAYGFDSGRGRVMSGDETALRLAALCIFYGARRAEQIPGDVFLKEARAAVFGDFDPLP